MNKWADIPGHVLELIAEKGTRFEDIVALGLVCKPWRVAAVQCKENFMKRQTEQLPWLMLPPIKRTNLRGIYSLARRRIHRIPSRESIDKKCYSSRGWLLTVRSDLGMNLLHPITLARFKLPEISFSKFRYKALKKPFLRFINRVILSDSPSLNSNFVLMIIQGSPAMPAYWRPGDKRWTLIEAPELAFADAVFYQDKCYFITFWGKLLVTDFGISNPTTATCITELPNDIIKRDCFATFYLVIIEGSLLLVSREGSETFHPEIKFEERPYHTIIFQVLKLDFKSLNWEKLESLGNWSIFLGHNSAKALNASLVKECKPNSIYFTEENLSFSYDTVKRPNFDMGIFNMADGSVEAIIEGEWHHRISPPIFVDPTV